MSKLHLTDARKMEKLLLSWVLKKLAKKEAMPFFATGMEEQLRCPTTPVKIWLVLL